MEEIKIRIDGQTPTVNHLYGHTMRGGFYMKPLAKSLRVEIVEAVTESAKSQGFVHSDWCERLLEVSVIIVEDWWTKKHTVKKKDISNREKFLIDSIFQGLGLDDQNIWKHTMQKRECLAQDIPEYYAEVIISKFRNVE